jgi:hypothetical protein
MCSSCSKVTNNKARPTSAMARTASLFLATGIICCDVSGEKFHAAGPAATVAGIRQIELSLNHFRL